MKKNTPVNLEELVAQMKLRRSPAADVLVALCNRADDPSNQGKEVKISIASPEAERLLPSLRSYDLKKAGEHLCRNIYIKDGELIVSPSKTKQAVAA